MTTTRPVRRIVAALVCASLSPLLHAQQVDCAALDDPVHHRVNPASSANLLTTWLSEAENAESRYGFTDDRGAPIRASRTPIGGLSAVHRLYKGSSGDFVWIANPAEIASAVANWGYVDQGPNFYASRTPVACMQPVYRYLKGSKHRHAFSDGERSTLAAAGWVSEGISFYARPGTEPEVDTTFSIAVMPDTQNEVFNGAPAARHVGRAQWLADNKSTLDLRFVLHSGDITNWGERDEPQYQIAVAGVAPLEQAGIPFAYTPGNHDTRAVCAGGSACPGESASANVRLLPLFSQYFNNRFQVSGRMEAGKIDNYYTLFEAGGVDWMVLSLELWPRTAVVDWARSVVAAHPTHNVIVVTHMYLNGDGTISTSNGGYGANSPKYLYDRLVSQYANVRFVFSGHTGQATHRIDTGVHGNRVVSFLQAMHSSTNPVRIVEIDTAANEASTWIYAPATQTAYPQYDAVVGGLDLID
ncbi:MAG: metallophosphoesterase [Luteimonas sp.]|nr:metallophosphoesterase [Luteimonas sp.]